MMTMSHQIENINTEKFFKKLILVLKSIKVIDTDLSDHNPVVAGFSTKKE